MAMICSSCGKALLKESVFCLFCGVRLPQEEIDAARTQVTSSPPVRHYPNRIGYLYLVALEQCVGASALEAIVTAADLTQYRRNVPLTDLRREFPFMALAAISEAIEDQYGQSRAYDIQLACGRKLYAAIGEEFGPALSVARVVLRLVPQRRRLQLVISAVANLFDRFSDQPTWIETHSGQLRYCAAPCALCWQRQTSQPCCTLALGFLHEAVQWATNGAHMRIEEIACRGCGDDVCIFLIEERTTLRAV